MKIIKLAGKNPNRRKGGVAAAIKALHKDCWGSDYTLYIERRTDPKIFSESAFFYRLKNLLNDAGLDCVKKKPDSDGHMISAPYYVRERNWNWCLTDPNYALRFVYEEYNAGKPVTLSIHLSTPALA